MNRLKMICVVQLGLVLTLLAVICFMWAELREDKEYDDKTIEAVEFYDDMIESFGDFDMYKDTVSFLIEVAGVAVDYFDEGNTTYISFDDFLRLEHPDLYAEMLRIDNILQEE